MDAITLLKDDHKTVEQLFKRFEKAGDRAYVEKRDIVDRFTEALSIHAAIEEQLFYPVVRATVPGTEDLALESLEEHHIVKWVLRRTTSSRAYVMNSGGPPSTTSATPWQRPGGRHRPVRTLVPPTRPRATWWSGRRSVSPTASAPR